MATTAEPVASPICERGCWACAKRPIEHRWCLVAGATLAKSARSAGYSLKSTDTHKAPICTATSETISQRQMLLLDPHPCQRTCSQHQTDVALETLSNRHCSARIRITVPNTRTRHHACMHAGNSRLTRMHTTHGQHALTHVALVKSINLKTQHNHLCCITASDVSNQCTGHTKIHPGDKPLSVKAQLTGHMTAAICCINLYCSIAHCGANSIHTHTSTTVRTLQHHTGLIHTHTHTHYTHTHNCSHASASCMRLQPQTQMARPTSRQNPVCCSITGLH